MLDFFVQIDGFLFKNININSSGGLFGACFVLGLMAMSYEGLCLLRISFLQRMEENLKSNTEVVQLRKGERPKYFSEWICYIIIQSIFHMLQVFLNYILMLSVMSYNAWILISVVLGAGIGFFLTGPSAYSNSIRTLSSNEIQNKADYSSAKTTRIQNTAPEVFQFR